ncbi:MULTISPECIES: efflux transporter outer membrane subunit [Chryseobacterium]|uniref:NodT family efflux transporter outer membrane factor (OMF) lipoprotein n=1 Tax=Chryseobacterium rhizosphaerae TaxID=395937 RepID=A0AAE3YC58_9FLAO|nr:MULTISPECIES: efflux transporter outer membrane subunit [Chryseobacterium]MBL3550451.1 efflux transporter outer membrane subunit [Chryseobacterium sp. KMC2]MDC8098706.1 efflux transporter outer membrane subunit [Chryseobacterium rhizosphaerae]MDR6527451.1 NodT family efflux transporter outer membrane factor (OMF) lipoprotein [Chryseobacterium rhizosphaerae]MDR6547501.1 NodT family efflux transporter outer membrane factor (OMF) lipoprotein [Chryseobacterium rhizosphaerae]
MKRVKNIILTFALALGSVSCVSKLAYTEPDLPLPEKFQYTATADTASIANLEWKEFFSDPILQGLIEKGIKNNYDLQIALKQVAASQEKLKQAKYMQYPDVGFGVTGQISKPSKNSMNGQSLNLFLGQSHVEDYNAAFNLSWEADIWGKIKNQQEVSRMQYLQTYEGSKAIQTQVVAAIAQGYYNLLMLDKQLAIAKSNLELSSNTLLITQKMWESGDTTSLGVQQSAAQKQATELLISQLEQNIAIQENALSILVGEIPNKVNRTIEMVDTSLPQDITTGLPAAMVSRRPDVRQQELVLLESNAFVGIAQANMYPALKITANGGVNSFKFDNWFQIPASLFGSVLGGITQPIFQKRQLKTDLEVAKIQREKNVLAFRQSVLNAVGEVSDALVSNENLKIQEQKATEQSTTLKDGIKSAQLLYRGGSANYLEVITAQGNSLQAELNLASIKRQRLSSIVDLYRALGGGWK